MKVLFTENELRRLLGQEKGILSLRGVGRGAHYVIGHGLDIPE